jgi:uncharacterized protein (DUF433 family)
MGTEDPIKTRHRLSADVPERTQARVRETAGRYYRGVVSDAVTTALETFHWVVDARSRGKRVIATDVDSLPDSYEELVIAGLDTIGSGDWTWLVKREHPWRRQLWIKGRNIAAGSLARIAAANGWTPEETAKEYDVPVAAVHEAFRYSEGASDLIDAEEAESRLTQRSQVAGLGERPLGAGIDRTHIRELLRLTPTERARLATTNAANMAEFERRRG